jgi:hypothetical protein
LGRRVGVEVVSSNIFDLSSFSVSIDKVPSRPVFVEKILDRTDMFTECDQWIVQAGARVCVEVDFIDFGGSGFGEYSIFDCSYLLDVAFDVDLRPFANVLALFHFNIRALEPEFLSALLESVVGEDTREQLAEQEVEAPVPLALKEL